MFRTSHSVAIVVVASIAVAVLTLASVAQANCDQCFSAKQSVSVERGRLLADFPGTGATLLACMATCSEQPESDRAGCILAACGMGCLIIGMDNCYNFFNRMAAVESRSKEVDTFCRMRSCQ